MKFEKGGARYYVDYARNPEREIISFRKTPIGGDEHDLLDGEHVSLRAWIDNKGYERGSISYFAIDTDYPPFNSPAAIQRVEDFLKSNLGEPQTKRPQQQ